MVALSPPPLVSALVFTAAVASLAAAHAAFVIDPSAVAREFTGIGGISGGGATSRLLVSYPEPLRSQLLDVLFTPGAGANIQILKVEIGGDAQSTDGSESSHMHAADDLNYHRGYEWWLMTEAKRRNPDIKLYGLPWAFPAWVGGASRSPYDFPELTASYIVKWVSGAKTVYGLDIDYVGIWNERPYNATYIEVLRKALDTAGFTDTKIVAPDGTWVIAGQILTDKALADAVYAIGAHYPGTTTTADALKTGKPLWASEDMSTYNDLRGAGCWARILNQNHVRGNMTTTISWNIIASYYHGLPWYGTAILTAAQPWANHWETSNRNLALIYGTAHTTYFTSPGWKYLASQQGVGFLTHGGSYVSLTNGTELTIVVEKMSWAHSQCIRPTTEFFATQTETVALQLEGEWAKRTVYLWQSKFGWDGMKQVESTYMQPMGPVKVSDSGTVTLNVEVDGLYTLTTLNRRPLAALPGSEAAAPFPDTYADNFDSYNISSEASYFADQAGVWEIATANDTAHGLVMRQMVPTRPICWSGDFSPYSVIGDNKWSDMTVQADVMVEAETPGAAFVGARLRPCCEPDGVFFALDTAGKRWVLGSNLDIGNSANVIAQGPTNVAVDTWYTLRLEVTGTSASGWINGASVFSGKAVGSGSGWASIGTGLVNPGATPPIVDGQATAATYVRAQFDNFQLSSAKRQQCATPAAGDGLTMAWCGSPNEVNTQWDIASSADPKQGTIELRHSSSPRLCATVGTGANAGAMTVEECNGGANQLFSFTNSTDEPWAAISNGDQALKASDRPGTVVSMGGKGGTCARACDPSSPDQQFTFTGKSVGGTGLLRDSAGRCVLGPCTQISANGCEPLEMGACDASDDNQLFTLQASGTLVNKANGGCLDLWGGVGPGVGLYKCHGAVNQQWVVDAAQSIIRSKVNDAGCLDAACVTGGNFFMLNEQGLGQISMYGPFVVDHCMAAGCPTGT